MVPARLRKRFNIEAGTALDWQEDGDSIRVKKLKPTGGKRTLEWLVRLGRIPFAERSKEKVKYE